MKFSAIPCIGTNFQMPLDFDHVTYYGRGPHENYWDRKTSAFFGIYQGEVKDIAFDYIRPQENGNRSDLCWVTLSNAEGVGVKISGTPSFDFSAHHQTISDFDLGIERGQAHHTDIVKKDLVNVQKNVDKESKNMPVIPMGENTHQAKFNDHGFNDADSKGRTSQFIFELVSMSFANSYHETSPSQTIL